MISHIPIWCLIYTLHLWMIFIYTCIYFWSLYWRVFLNEFCLYFVCLGFFRKTRGESLCFLSSVVWHKLYPSDCLLSWYSFGCKKLLSDCLLISGNETARWENLRERRSDAVFNCCEHFLIVLLLLPSDRVVLNILTSIYK